MERDEYYFLLNPRQLAYDDPALIIAIEAASYCELHGEKSIRFVRLKERCDDFLNIITNGDRPSFGGNFVNIIKNCSRRGFLIVEKIGKKETWISPNIPAVKKKVDAIQTEDSDSRNKQVRILDRDAKVSIPKSITESNISFSDTATCKVTPGKPETSK